MKYFKLFDSNYFLATVLSKTITISQCGVIGNKSTGVAETGLKGSPNNLLLIGLHKTTASFGRLAVGLHETYITLSISLQLRIARRQSLCKP